MYVPAVQAVAAGDGDTGRLIGRLEARRVGGPSSMKVPALASGRPRSIEIASPEWNDDRCARRSQLVADS